MCSCAMRLKVVEGLQFRIRMRTTRNNARLRAARAFKCKAMHDDDVCGTTALTFLSSLFNSTIDAIVSATPAQLCESQNETLSFQMIETEIFLINVTQCGLYHSCCTSVSGGCGNKANICQLIRSSNDARNRVLHEIAGSGAMKSTASQIVLKVYYGKLISRAFPIEPFSTILSPSQSNRIVNLLQFCFNYCEQISSWIYFGNSAQL